MAHISLIPAHRAGPELSEAYGYVNRRWQMRAAPPMAIQIVQCFSHRPALLRAVADGYFYAGWCGTLPRTARETVAVMVSRENDCFY